MDIVTYALCKKIIKNAIDNLGDVFTLKGNVASIDNLPQSGNNPGDIYLVGPKSDDSYDEYYWTSNNTWEIMGATINFEGIINEEILYAGEEGTGTIENPAEDTILYVVNGEFVKKSGDTMTGKLTVPTLSVGSSNTVEEGCVGEGDHVQAMNMNSHAEGYYTHAYGKNSHAEGDYSTASGEDAHAEGYTTVAQGNYSHSEGNSTDALNKSQHVQGEWNVQDQSGTASTRGTYAHIIGNGTGENARSNAATVKWNGEAWFAGDVYTGSTSGTNKDAGSKKLATDDTFMGTNGTENGSKGLVPAPTSQDTNKYLKSDGTWSEVSGGGTSYTAGDYIDITNNEISVDGIATKYSTITNLTPIINKAVCGSIGDEIEIMDYEDMEYFTYTNPGLTQVFHFEYKGFGGTEENEVVITDDVDCVVAVYELDYHEPSVEEYPIELRYNIPTRGKIYFNSSVNRDSYVKLLSNPSGELSNYIRVDDIFGGTDGATVGMNGLVPAPTPQDTDKYLKSDGTWASVSGGGETSDYTQLINKPSINNVTLTGNKTTADLGLDMVILSYGNSTWQEFLNAYRRNAVVYCRAGSGSDPASGNQPRLAFMAYINNVTSPTEVEFQYYRSVSTKTASQQGDQVIIYKLTSSGTWTVTTRENGSKVVAGTNMTSSYSNGVLTLNASDSIFEGTDGTNAGTKGLVPAPTASDTDKYLKSDGTWATISGGSGNYVSKTGDTMTGTLTTPNIIVGNQKNSTTLGTKSSIFGRDGTASGNYCIVEGDGCTAKDDACHAEGRNCIAGAGGNGGDYAHAEGCETKATGFCSHSEGYYTTASEYYTHAEGERTVAAGTHSHAEGYGTKANRGFTHVQGVYNILDDTGSASSKGTYAHIVGNGSADNNRKNIHTIKWTGEAWFQGDVYVGSTSGKNKDEGSKKLATEEYVRNLLQEFATLNNLNMPS